MHSRRCLSDVYLIHFSILFNIVWDLADRLSYVVV
jgi:hypothetical protein